MGNKFWSKDNIFGLAGIVAYAVATLAMFVPFKGEQAVSLIDWHSLLGKIVIVLFVISLGLYAWGIFKRESNLRYLDQKALLEARQEYLPDLREAIHKRFEIAKQLRAKAAKLPLTTYWSKHLKYTWRYIGRKRIPKPLEITNELRKRGFVRNNTEYRLLKENDGRYRHWVGKYDLANAQNNDKKLRGDLHTLWKSEHLCGSIEIFALLNMNNSKIPNIPSGVRGGLWGKDLSEEGWKTYLTEVEKRIDELLIGGDL